MDKDGKESKKTMLEWIKKFRDQHAAQKAKEERFRSSLGIRLKTPPTGPDTDKKPGPC